MKFYFNYKKNIFKVTIKMKKEEDFHLLQKQTNRQFVPERD